VPGHGGGVAQAEVDVLVPVDVGQVGAAGPAGVDRVTGHVLVHPGHRDPAEEIAGPGVRGGGSRVPVGEIRPLAIRQAGQACAVGRHGATVRPVAGAELTFSHE
jgi:hypothetical protein